MVSSLYINLSVINLFIVEVTLKKASNSSAVTCCFIMSLNMITDSLDISLISFPKSVSFMITPLPSLGFFSLDIAPLSSIVFKIRERLASLSRILKTMEDKGAISREKNPSDGRGVIIKLTDFGKEMREISKESVIIFNDIIKQHVTAEELEAFFKVTSTINKLITDKLIYKEDTINKAV